MKPTLRHLAFSLLGLLTLLHCGGGKSTGNPSSPIPAPTITSFRASPTSLAVGGSSTLTWSVVGATSLSIDQGVPAVSGATGSVAVSPTATTTYTLTATGAGGTSSLAQTVTVTGGTAPSQWVVGYYVGYHNYLQTPAQVDYSAMTHIGVGAALPNADGSWATHFYLDTTSGPIWAKEVVTRAHAAGIKAILMLGGAGANAGFEASRSPAILATSITNLKAIVDSYGFDGVDLDWEGYDVASWGGDVIAYLKAIRAAMPDKVLTFPTGWNNSNFNNLVNPHYGLVAALVDRVDTMSYGMLWAPDGWNSWHMTALYGNKGNTPSSLDDTVKALIQSGVPKAKIGIGLGFYGYDYEGPDSALVSAPDQSTNALMLGPSDNTLSYSNLLQSVITPDVVRWDDVPQSTYLSFAQPKQVTVGGAVVRTRYITYEDERSIAAKGNWARAQGLGGAILWTISEGYLPWRTTGEKDPLMKAVKAAFLSPGGAPQILTFSPSSIAIKSGQSVTLNWTVANTTSATIDHAVGPVTGTSASVIPVATTSYTLSVTNASGAVITATCTVVVN